MGIHICFAENLRQLCYRYQSIAEVCEGIGINRQQFNKYLAGKNLPNALTLQRICRFLGIAEEELFQLGPRGANPGQPAQPNPLPAPPQLFAADEINRLCGAAVRDAASAMLPGRYHCYFPLQNNGQYLLRTLVCVRRCAKGVAFSRLTVFPAAAGSRKFLARAKHEGLVVANSSEIYLLGANKSPPHQLSFISLERPSGGVPFLLSGLAIIKTSSVPMSARACLQYLGNSMSARDAIRALGPVPRDCQSVPILVRATMANFKEDSTDQLMGMSFAQALVRSMSPGGLVFSA